jgi:hypothetical protein
MGAKRHGESVIFCFVREGQVLCERREWDGSLVNSVPGGQVAAEDRKTTDYRAAALYREVAEELAVVPTEYEWVGQVWYGKKWLFHVCLVRAWEGEIPPAVLDTQRPLHWVHPQDLVDNTRMLGLSELIRRSL